MKSSLTSAQIEALRQIDACLLANTIESFHARLRNEGFADSSIRSLLPDLPPMVGHAATLKIRGSLPPTAGAPPTEDTSWWDYVLSVPPPRVLVIQDVGSKPGLGALLGEVHINILKALGCSGAVTNGSMRDLPAIKRLGFPLFAGNVGISHSYIHIVETGTPVEVGGLKVHSGDILHGDLHGVQSIPAAIATEIPERAERLRSRERALIALCRDPEFSLEKLRGAIASAKL